MEEVKTETEITLTPEQQQQVQTKIKELTARVAELEAEKKTDALRTAKTLLETKPANRAPGAAIQAMTRDRAIAEIGGLALWSSLELSQRLKILLGCQWMPSPEDIQLAKSLFGPQSSAANASRIAANNPDLYSRMRILYREL
jgi:hypothetical protein